MIHGYVRAGKYNIKKVIVDGKRFDSPSESQYYSYLKLLSTEARSGIKLLELQPKVYLTDAKILYKPDFLIEENGEKIYIDVKGVSTPTFKIKLRLWKHYAEGKLRIVKKDRRGFRVTDEILGAKSE